MFYLRTTISEEAKFSTVSLATFSDNNQALYRTFQRNPSTILSHHRSREFRDWHDWSFITYLDIVVKVE